MNDLLYIAHPEYPPAKLIRNADNDWDYEAIVWDWPPVLDENIEDITIEPSDIGPGTITLTASEPHFRSGARGQLLDDRTSPGNATVTVALDASSGNSSTIYMLPGEWELTTYGNWQGTLPLDRQQQNMTTAEILRTWDFRKYWSSERECDRARRETLLPCSSQWTADGEAGDFEPVAILELEDNRGYGIVQITGFTSATSVTALDRA